jgi:hypothetical protein
MMGSAAIGSWKDYCMTDECMHIGDLFLNNFIKVTRYALNFLLFG